MPRPPRQRQHRIDIQASFEVVGEGVEGAVDHGVTCLSRRSAGADEPYPVATKPTG